MEWCSNSNPSPLPLPTSSSLFVSQPGDGGREGKEGIKNVEGWEADVREGDKLVALNRVEEALKKFERVSRACPGWEGGWDKVVQALVRMNKWGRVREVCERWAVKEERKEFEGELYDGRLKR